jgi:peptide methionine sulfoxide reductase msrA/msrB
MKKIEKSDKERKRILTPEQYNILRKKGTEAAGSSEFLYNKEKGTYHCIACGNLLFTSDDKFDSGTGWPSFKDVASNESVLLKRDDDGMRVEVLCRKCGGHLGHVFDDGPKPIRKRYCMNGVVLEFRKDKLQKGEIAIFGAGCFWHVQHEFDGVDGVLNTEVGYMGGDEKNFPDPTYEEICTDKTGYAEVVKVVFDPEKISYEKLLDVFWNLHDPTTLNRQGPDVGNQYRSAIFYSNDEQRKLSEESKKKMQRKHDKKIVTEIVKARIFFRAEEYHQKYFEKNKVVACGI